ncbi:MAG: gluconokinase [Saprospiraceae bacterium]|nr:gluconokinase [Saprospiraceae bacterium]
MIIGIDIGTTNVKAVAVDDNMSVLITAERQNHLLSPYPGWSEHEPEAVLENVISVLKDVLKRPDCESPIQAVVFSSAMHGWLAVDENGNALTNIWLWSDLRSDRYARDLRRDQKAPLIYRKTGVPVHAMSPLCKTLWCRSERPEIFSTTHKILGIKEYVWLRLTGEYCSDLSLASATGLMDIGQNVWASEALDTASIAEDRLPALVSPGYIKKLPEHYAEKFGLPVGLPLMIGASDGALANLGSGATETGHAALTIGTSAAIRIMTNTPLLDGQMRTFCYRLDEKRCITGGASNNGTNALEWLRTGLFHSQEQPDAFTHPAAEVLPGAEGLTFLPYLQGERAPIYDADARGTLHGLAHEHGQTHIIRAVMEGILYNMKYIAGALEAHFPIDTLHAGGGFSQNAFWVQMLADIFQKPIWVGDTNLDASLKGAIFFAREVLGLPKLQDDNKGKYIQPRPGYNDAYREGYERFSQLAGRLHE